MVKTLLQVHNREPHTSVITRPRAPSARITLVELKHLVTHFVYRIEPKPEGGFIARASDPSVPPLEAPTREELQQKIQQTILSGLATEFPGLKLPGNGTKTQVAFHVEHSPGGGFSIHSADPNVGVINTASPQEFQSRFLEKLLNFAGNHLTPELTQALSQVNSGDINVVVNKTVFTTKGNINSGAANLLPLGVALQTKSPTPDITADQVAIGGTIGNAAILPEKSNFGKFLRLVLALLIAAALIYFLLHR